MVLLGTENNTPFELQTTHLAKKFKISMDASFLLATKKISYCQHKCFLLPILGIKFTRSTDKSDSAFCGTIFFWIAHKELHFMIPAMKSGTLIRSATKLIM
jgi:hypothetical protein